MEPTKSWVKGSLPGWATTILIGLCGTLLMDLRADFRELRKSNTNHETRITVVENGLTDLKQAQHDAVTELKEINVHLQTHK